jgi:hypothetical protein
MSRQDTAMRGPVDANISQIGTDSKDDEEPADEGRSTGDAKPIEDRYYGRKAYGALSDAEKKTLYERRKARDGKANNKRSSPGTKKPKSSNKNEPTLSSLNRSIKALAQRLDDTTVSEDQDMSDDDDEEPPSGERGNRHNRALTRQQRKKRQKV